MKAFKVELKLSLKTFKQPSECISNQNRVWMFLTVSNWRLIISRKIFVSWNCWIAQKLYLVWQSPDNSLSLRVCQESESSSLKRHQTSGCFTFESCYNELWQLESCGPKFLSLGLRVMCNELLNIAVYTSQENVIWGWWMPPPLLAQIINPCPLLGNKLKRCLGDINSGPDHHSYNVVICSRACVWWQIYNNA